MKIIFLRICAVIFFLTNIPSIAAADSLSFGISQIETSTFPAVKAFVSVSNTLGPVKGLTASNFRVDEDGKIQSPITVSEIPENADPVSVALTMDYSNSMPNNSITSMKTAVSSFINNMKVNDAGEIIKFAKLYGVIQPFTTDKSLLLAAVAAPKPATWTEGDTAFYDSTYLAITDTAKRPGRKAIIAFTDGDDTNSEHTLDEVIAYALNSGIPVYTIGLQGEALDPALLGKLADQTGGEFHIAPTAASLQTIYRKISQTLSRQYSIIYQSKLTAGCSPHIITIDVIFNNMTQRDRQSFFLNCENKLNPAIPPLLLSE